jgi:hypothetical protein
MLEGRKISTFIGQKSFHKQKPYYLLETLFKLILQNPNLGRLLYNLVHPSQDCAF